MTDRFSEDEIIAAVARLTRPRLTAFIEAEVITPTYSDTGWVFRPVDLVRIELLCDLTDQFGLADDALGVVVSLIDQLHDLRGELRAVLGAIAAEPAEVRARIGTTLHQSRAAS